MLEAIVKHGIIFYAMGVIMAIGLFSKFISHTTLRKMVREASEIQKSNHRLMRLVKSKFEHASMVSDKVQNVEAFVNKYLFEYRVLGVRMETWRGLVKKSIWIMAAVGLLGSLLSFNQQGMNELTFQHISWTGIFTMLLFVVQMMSDENVQLNAARNYIVDYLENVCIHRYEKVNQEIAKAEELEEMPPQPEIREEPAVSKERAEQELRIRAILEEFLA